MTEGFVWALIGAALASFLPGIGSALGVSGVSRAVTGIVTEDPTNYNKFTPLQLLPASQALYGLLCSFFIFLKVGLINTPMALTEITKEHGLAFFALSLPIAVVGLISAILQGKVCASGVLMVAKRPDMGGKAITMATYVELFALFALIISFLGIMSVA